MCKDRGADVDDGAAFGVAMKSGSADDDGTSSLGNARSAGKWVDIVEGGKLQCGEIMIGQSGNSKSQVHQKVAPKPGGCNVVKTSFIIRDGAVDAHRLVSHLTKYRRRRNRCVPECARCSALDAASRGSVSGTNSTSSFSSESTLEIAFGSLFECCTDNDEN